MLTTVPSAAFYVRFYEYKKEEVWDSTNSAMTAIGSVAVVDCSIAQTFNITHQVGSIVVPSDLPKDLAYVIHIYDKNISTLNAKDTPDNTLLLVNNKEGAEFFSSFQFPIPNSR